MTLRALSIAGSQSAGLRENFGTMTKPLHAGQSSRHGAYAALLAKESFTAAASAFEHPQGFFEVFNGAGTYDPSQALARWANPLDILDPGPQAYGFELDVCASDVLRVSGMSPDAPGLFFCGLCFQYAFSSMVLPGVGRDAAYVAERIAARSRTAVLSDSGAGR